MFTNPIIRILIGLPLAAIIVLGLYAFMNFAISGNFKPNEDSQKRVLESITPQQEDSDVRQRRRSKPRRLDNADKPPPPPKLSSNKSQIDLPTATIQGAAPTEVKFDRVQSLAIDPVAISDRDAQPIRPPLPQYPDRALQRGTEGECDVRFDVDVRGRPFNISATCSDSVFLRAAERAVSKVEFAPKIVRGTPAERRNVVYPLVFTISD